MLDASTGGHNLLLKDFVATIGFGEFELQFPLTENGNHSSDVESLFEQKESHVFIECGAQTALVYPVATTGLSRQLAEDSGQWECRAFVSNRGGLPCQRELS